MQRLGTVPRRLRVRCPELVATQSPDRAENIPNREEGASVIQLNYTFREDTRSASKQERKPRLPASSLQRSGHSLRVSHCSRPFIQKQEILASAHQRDPMKGSNRNAAQTSRYSRKYKWEVKQSQL